MKYFWWKATAVILILTWVFISVTGCQSKKKALSIEKTEIEQSSEVKKRVDGLMHESKSKFAFSHLADTTWHENEETIQADSARIDSNGARVLYGLKINKKSKGSQKSDLKSSEKKQVDIKSQSSVKIDSVGKTHVQVKVKKDDKSVKMPASVNLILSILFFGAFAWAVYAIRKQIKLG